MTPDDDPMPHTVNGNYLNWRARLRWRLGLYPFRRCPNGSHMIRNIYGDEIIARNWKRSKCLYCRKTWPYLDGKSAPT